MRNLSFAERVWWQTACLVLAFLPLALIARHFDARMINDISIWIKPAKFYVSLPLHLVTLAVLASFMPSKTRTALWMSVVAAISAVAMILELVPVTGQAMRGVPSHFNFETQFDALMYALMGVGAVLMIMPALVMGARFLFLKTSEVLTPGLKLGAGLGLIFGFFLTLFLGGYMSFQPTGHWVGAPPTDEGGLPIFGWSRQGGDLRVSHFFATHLMQALPLVGYLADRFIDGDGSTAKRIVWVAAIIGVGLSIATFVQALAGQPFIK